MCIQDALDVYNQWHSIKPSIGNAMTLKELYDQLEPIVMKFHHDESAVTGSVKVHAANSILNFFMAVLYRCVEMKEPDALLSLALVVGLHVIQSEPKLWKNIINKLE